MSIISDNMRKARKAAGFESQEKAAQALRIKRSLVGAYEEGRCMPPLSFFPTIARTYRIKDWLGFITNPNFDPADQRIQPPDTSTSLLQEQYASLTPKLKKV